ncbi:MAG: hypothetical protein Q9166_005365 [cf. Caloplaca sp. 2 TL-2023]
MVYFIGPWDELDSHLFKSSVAKTANRNREYQVIDLRTRLPQELVDKIKEVFFERVFYPGYHFPQLRDEEAYIWKGKQYDKAHWQLLKQYTHTRPELLTLSKDIYSKYKLRLWTENTCVVKTTLTDSGRYCELIPVKGHMLDCGDYLKSACKEDRDTAWVEAQWSKRLRAVSPSPPELRNFLKRLGELQPEDIIELTLRFSDCCEHLGYRIETELEDNTGKLDASGRILWYALSLIMKRKEERHKEYKLEDVCAELKVIISASSTKIFVFT